MSVCLSVRMNAEISEPVRAWLLGLGMQMPELSAQQDISETINDRKLRFQI